MRVGVTNFFLVFCFSPSKFSEKVEKSGGFEAAKEMWIIWREKAREWRNFVSKTCLDVS